MKAIVIALVVALVGLGAWVIIDRSSTSDTAPSGDAAQLWNDYTDAWNNYDGDAFLALVTPEYTFVNGDSTTNAESQARSIASASSVDWNVTMIGEAIMVGDGPWYLSQANRIEMSSLPESIEGISVLTIVDVGGVLKVASHTFYG